MNTTSPERLVPEIFASADVAVNGSRPWDIQVHHHLFYKRLAAGGSMALGESYMATRYHVEVVGITVSKEQGKLARHRCKGLPVTIKLMDYRPLTGTFDRIVSVGMFEHVGVRHYCTFMRMIYRCLALEGLFFAAHHRR